MVNSPGKTTSGDAVEVPAEPITDESGHAGRDSPPIVWLARVGALIVALQAYIYIRWILSDEFTPIPPGPDPVPTHTVWIIKIAEAICIVGTIASIIWLVRKTRREGRFPTIGVFLVAWLLAAWQDVGVNAVRPVFGYNTEFFQMGTWAEFVPGWVSKGAETPAPILYTLGDYFLFFPLAVLGINAMVERARKRWPRLNKAGIVAGLLLLFLVLDTIGEQLLQRQGLWTYFRVNETWSMFTGTIAQFPLYENIVFGSIVMVLSICIYIFRRKDGGLVSDAGIERLKTKRGVSIIRILALTAVINAIMLVFNLGYNLVNQHADITPPSVPSYLHVEMCGAPGNLPCPPPR